MAGSMFGLTPSEASDSSRRDKRDKAPPERDAAPSSPKEPGGLSVPSPPLKVVLTTNKRPVRINHYQVASGVSEEKTDLEFFNAADMKSAPLEAKLAVEADGRASLEIAIRRDAKSGLWKAAVCDAHRVQIGVIEIEL